MSAPRVLVVEDSRTQAEALRGLLEAHGYQVDVELSGEAALARPLEPIPDLVLSDVVMPGMSGHEFCRQFKERLGPDAPPVVLLTGLSEARDIVRGLESGADNYVTKPYEPDLLLDRIRHVLAHRAERGPPRPAAPLPLHFLGEQFHIAADREQILELLLSSFAELGRTNEALQRSQRALTEANSRERLARQAAEEDARRAEAASRARDEVLATVSHDLRNPVGTIFTGASLLLELELGEEGRRRQLQIIRRTAERMNHLIQDLLDFSKMEAGRFTVEPFPERVEAILREVRESMDPLAAARDIALSDHADDPRARVLADRPRILQVFSNLIGNAIKFTPQGGKISVSVTEEADGVAFRVADTGAGIDPEMLPHVFDRYWQGGQRDREGAGLGLAIVQGIVEAHGGRLSVESELGTGTAFTFTLPLASDATVPPAATGEPS